MNNQQSSFNQVNPYNNQGAANQGPSNVDPNAMQTINQGLAASLGNFFFNMNDLNVAKTNIPIKG